MSLQVCYPLNGRTICIPIPSRIPALTPKPEPDPDPRGNFPTKKIVDVLINQLGPDPMPWLVDDLMDAGMMKDLQTLSTIGNLAATLDPVSKAAIHSGLESAVKSLRLSEDVSVSF